MALPTAAAVGGGVGRALALLRDRPRPPAREPAPPAASARRCRASRSPCSALTLAGFALSSALGVAPVWVAAAGAAAITLPALARRATAPRALVRAAEPGFLVFVLGLGVIVARGERPRPGLGGRALVPPRRRAARRCCRSPASAAILANLVNNLPATLILVPGGGAGRARRVLAVLIGVNVGPNLTYVGSLATLLWRRVLHVEDTEVAARRVRPPRRADGAGGARRGDGAPMVRRAGTDLRCARSSGSSRTPGRRRSPRPPRSCPPTPRSRCCTSRRATSRRSPAAARHGLLGRRRPPPPRAAAARDLRRGRPGAAGRGARAARPRGRAPSAAAGASSARWSAAAGARTCSCSRATATTPGSGRSSLGPPARFVVDHAPCRVLLVWADAPPDVDTIPPPPARPAAPPLANAERPRDASRGARGLRARAPHGRGRRRLRRALRAVLHRAARPALRVVRGRSAVRGAWRALLRGDRRDRGRARRPSCACSTTSARSRPTGSSASRRSAT